MREDAGLSEAVGREVSAGVVADYAAWLRGATGCEVRDDAVGRALYATDASIYEIEPLVVVIPRTEEDLAAAARGALERKLPILPRGAGTSLAGQAVGRAVVIDASKYLTRIRRLDPDARTVRVQPGVVLEQLNQAAGKHGLMFGPDVATANRATLGGMVGNNSAGTRSIRHGMTVDHVRSLRVFLADGTETRLASVPREELPRLARGTGVAGRCYRELPGLIDRHGGAIRAAFPPLKRRVGGYNLDRMLDSDRFDPAKLVVGSEGTLAVVAEADLDLVEVPRAKALAVLQFDDLFATAEAVPAVLETDPSAVELMDKLLLDLSGQSLLYRHKRWFLRGDPAGLLIVEYSGNAMAEVDAARERLEGLLTGGRVRCQSVWVDDPAKQAEVWEFRKAGLPLLMGMPGRRKPVSFVEDGAVDPARLGEYVRRFDQIVRGHGTEAAYHAHASVGLLHLRPLIDLKDAADVARMADIQRDVCELVLELGGTMSAEHGDGLARSHLNRRIFGDEVYGLFQRVKRLFDPEHLLNPGKIVDAPAMTENLRLGPDYAAALLPTVLDFDDQGGFAEAIELCNGAGVCRKRLSGTMCPSYMVTDEEEHSTRGRANALREAIAGHLPAGAFHSPRVKEVMDLCLSCKACKSECPSNVDLARIKSEWSHQVHQIEGTPLRDLVFGHVAAVNRWGSRLAPIANRLTGLPVVRWINEKLLGIDRRRRLPRFASTTFVQWFRERTVAEDRATRGSVALFPDCFCNYNEPEIGIAAVRVLEACGFEVVVPEAICCGRAMISRGLLTDAKAQAEANLRSLSPLVDRGIHVVGLEPSCILTFRDEYQAFRLGEPARRLADRSLMIDEFLVEHAAARLPELRLPESRAMLHGHCHQKSLAGTSATEMLLGRIDGLELTVPDCGCCGMAGSFGYAREHYDVSMAIAERALLPAVRSAPPDAHILAPGTSCRHQIRDGTGRDARHPIELVADAMADGPAPGA